MMRRSPSAHRLHSARVLGTTAFVLVTLIVLLAVWMSAAPVLLPVRVQP